MTYRIGPWFTATFAIFFARAFLYSTFVSRGPEVMDLLHINTVQMGVFTMLYPLGGLLGVGFSSGLVHRFGSKTVTVGIYSLAAVSLVALGPAITAGNVPLASLLLIAIGLPMAIADYVGNYEGSLADKASSRSIFSAIHGGYGVGMLLAAAIAGVLSSSGLPLAAHFALIGVVTIVGTALGVYIARCLPFRRIAMWEARRPSTTPDASISTHSCLSSSAFAEYVFMTWSYR